MDKSGAPKKAAVLRWIRRFVICSVMVAWQAECFAAPNASAAAAEEFAKAEREFAAQDYSAALRSFRKAHALHRHDAVLFNIAVCLERLGRFKEAAEAYEQASRSDQISAEHRERAGGLAKELRARLATLRIEGTPSGAAVLIAGRHTCTLPCTVQLDPQTTRVVVTSAGREWARDVVLDRGGEVTLRASVPPARPKRSRAAPPPKDSIDRAPSAPYSPGPLTWIGAGGLVVGATGTVLFGTRAVSLHDEYDRQPTRETLDDGRQSQLFANISLGVAAVGAVAILVDLLLLEKSTEPVRR